MTHIDTAKAAAETLEIAGLSHPFAERTALRGILHALLALHEPAEPTTINSPSKPTRTRTTTQKAADK